MRISDWSSDVCSSDLRGHRLARLGRLDQRANDGRLIAGAIERLLDRDHVGIGGGLTEKGQDDVETFIGMMDDDVLAADRREAVAAMFADTFRETRRIEIGRAHV